MYIQYHPVKMSFNRHLMMIWIYLVSVRMWKVKWGLLHDLVVVPLPSTHTGTVEGFSSLPFYQVAHPASHPASQSASVKPSGYTLRFGGENITSRTLQEKQQQGKLWPWPAAPCGWHQHSFWTVYEKPVTTDRPAVLRLHQARARPMAMDDVWFHHQAQD